MTSLLDQRWFDRFQALGGYSGSGNNPKGSTSTPEFDPATGIMTWEAGNDSAVYQIRRLFRARGHRATFSADIRRASTASIPRLLARVQDANEDNLLASANRDEATRVGAWERLSCSIVANHPDSHQFQFRVQQEGTGAYEMRNAAVVLERIPDQFGENIRGFQIGDADDGGVLYPNGDFIYYKRANINLNASVTNIDLEDSINSPIRVLADRVIDLTCSVTFGIIDEAGIGDDDVHISGIFGRARRLTAGGRQVRIAVFNSNPKSSSRVIPFMIVLQGSAGIERMGY
jgi:hypothetical protein